MEDLLFEPKLIVESTDKDLFSHLLTFHLNRQILIKKMSDNNLIVMSEMFNGYLFNDTVFFSTGKTFYGIEHDKVKHLLVKGAVETGPFLDI